MRALAEALAVRTPPNIDAFEGFEDNGDDEHFHNACIDEIDRYRRIDEWIPSHHNILSATALDCTKLLAKAGAIQSRPADFLQYTSDGSSDFLRLNAFENLMDLGFAKSDAILRWFLFVLATDPSPFVRGRMLRIFGRTLGSIAIGDQLEAEKAQQTQQDGLVIEQEASTEARQVGIARKQTIEGALNALRDELSSNAVLEIEIWNAITSPTLSLQEMGELLDICDLLYTPETSLIVTLRYPRYWTCTKTGKGKVSFSRSSRIRTTLIPARRPAVPSPPKIKRENSSSNLARPPAPPSGHAPTKLKLGGPKKPPLFTSGPSTPAPLEAVAPSPAGNSQGEAPKVILKLKIGGLKANGAGSPPS